MPRNNRTIPSARLGLPSTFLSLLTGWVEQGVESFFATQRVLVDVAMRQNAAMTKTLREGFADAQHSPVAILTDLAIEGTSSFTEAQKILLNLAHQQNAMLMNATKGRMIGSARGAAVMDLVHRSLDTLIRMQQDFLATSSKQTIGWLEAVRAGKGYRNTHMIDLARESMDNFVQSQKKFLDIIAEETSKLASGKPVANAKAMKRTELSRLAGEATNSFIDAQKKLLDVVGQQMNVNLRAANRTIDLISPARFWPMANVTGEGVKNFVAAEKALIESMVKRGTGLHAEVKPSKRPSRHVRPGKKVHLAHAGA